MIKKNYLLYMGKIALSGILAFIILTVFCCFYYNVPVHHENSDGSTDYKWEPNVFYCRGTEGFAWGKTNNDGFINTFDYEEGMQIDILLMGSSHMEAYQVGMNECTASRLNVLLGDDAVYNIGVSGHTFLTCVSNLEAAIRNYQPRKYIIIETSNLTFSEDALTQTINGTTEELPSSEGGVIGLLQKNPFLRLTYHQIRDYLRKGEGNMIDIEEDTDSTDINSAPNDEQLLNTLLQRIKKIAEKGNVEVIILYHPRMTINSDGTICLLSQQNTVWQFQELCENNGLDFLDMSSRFEYEYKESYILPYGFSNSSVGNGHLNKYGHAMIADELYRLVSREEK